MRRGLSSERRVMSFHRPLCSYSRLTETFPLESLQIPIANSSDCSKIPLNRHQPGPAGLYKPGCEGDYCGFTKALFGVKPLAFPRMAKDRAQESRAACAAWQQSPLLTNRRFINADKVNSACIIHICIYQVFMLTT